MIITSCSLEVCPQKSEIPCFYCYDYRFLSLNAALFQDYELPFGCALIFKGYSLHEEDIKDSVLKACYTVQDYFDFESYTLSFSAKYRLKLVSPQYFFQLWLHPKGLSVWIPQATKSLDLLHVIHFDSETFFQKTRFPPFQKLILVLARHLISIEEEGFIPIC